MSGIIENATLITPTGVIHNGWLAWDRGKIIGIGVGKTVTTTATTIIDADSMTLTAGFIDLHVHGAIGYDTMDGTVESILAQAEHFAQHGVTGFLPTTLTNPDSNIRAALNAIHEAMHHHEHHGAAILGAHLEGPYLNREKAGAQNPQHIRLADHDEYMAWLETGIVKLVAVAPEFSPNHAYIQDCVEHGIVVAAAHTDATFAQMAEAIQLGITHITHTFNGMRGLHHREPGIVGAALLSPGLVCELIADNIHVHPAAMRLLWEVKGADNIILISDATRGAGMPDGEYEIGGLKLWMQDGAARLENGALAGSTLMMNRAAQNFAAVVGSFADIWKATSLNAARQIGLADHKGSLEIGKDADLVLFDTDYNIHLTVVNGNVVYQP